jgi:hypothetical protein
MTYFHAATQSYFNSGDGFILGDVRYPYQVWGDAAMIASLGLVPVVDVGTPKDPRYFVNTEELVGAERRVVSAPKDPSVIAADKASDVEAKKTTIRAVREEMLNRLAGIAFAAQLSGDTATTDAFLVVRQGLLDITKNLPTDPELVDAEVMTRYASLAGQCTPQMVTAFAGVDA